MVTGLQAAWGGAEAHTSRAMAHAYEGLDDEGRDELDRLSSALRKATAR